MQNSQKITEAIGQIVRQLTIYGSCESAMEAQLVITVAIEPICTTRYLRETLGVSQATISRITRTVGDGYGRHRRKRRWVGRDLVCGYKDPKDTRCYRYKLTEKGENLLASFHNSLAEAFGVDDISAPT
ncbi:hypothetical protein A8B82_10810 [Sulfitobacter sp. EhC04]|nr:hypothetical protein A8B82_10810 [Sulfitobacter sp. EhC04]